jgi:TonB family protein
MAGLERLLIGRTLDGRYVIEELIGSGRSGLVYRGRHARLGSELAVKVLTLPRKAETRERYRRLFRHEATAAAALRHPNLPLVIGSGTDPELDLDFFVTELLEGERLSAVLSQRGRPPAALAMRVFTDAVSGVAAGHAAGMLHRDLRPANLYLVRAQGEKQKRVRVMGFGVPQMMPRETMTSTDLGLIGYAPPEFFSGGRLTSVGDVFGLGSIGYELLTGVMPYDQQARRELAAGRMAKLEPHPELAAAPPHVAAAILRALRVDPAERFDDAQAFAAALADPSFADAEPPIAVAAPAAAEPVVAAQPAAAEPIAVAARPAIAVPIVVASAVAASESAAPETAPAEAIAIPQAEPIAAEPVAITEPEPLAAVEAEAEPAPSASTEVAAEASEAVESVDVAAESIVVAEIIEEPVVAAQAESTESVDEIEAALIVAESAVDAAPAAEADPAPVYTPAPAPMDRFRMPPPAPRRDSPRDLELYYPPEEKPAPEAAPPIPSVVPAIAAAAAVVPAAAMPAPIAEPVAEVEPVEAFDAPAERVVERAAEIEWEPTIFAPAEMPRAGALEPQTVLDLTAPESARSEPAPAPILFAPSETEAPAQAAPMPVPARRPFRVTPPSTRSRFRPSMVALVVVVVAVGSVSWIAMHRPATANEGDPAATAANQLAAGAAVPAEGAPAAPTADSTAQAAARTPIQPLPEQAAARAEEARPTPEERAAQARLAQQQLAAQQQAAQAAAAQTPPSQTPAQRPPTQPAPPPAQTAAAPQPAPAPPPAPTPREQLAASTEPARPAAPAVYDIASVEQRPVLVNGPEVARTLQERYPRQLQQNRVTGRVTATFVVREDGSVDPSSIRVVDSPNSGFNSPTAAVLRRARFSPARVNGESVKVQVTMPVTWSVNE